MIDQDIHKSGFDKALAGDQLRPLEWAALNAKFAAARDLRQLFSNRAMAAAGNFAHFSSCSDEKLNEKPADINLDALGECKVSGAIKPDTASEAATGDREF